MKHQEQNYLFEVQLHLGALDPDAVRVELFAEGQDGRAPVREPLTRREPLDGSSNGSAYFGLVPKTRPVADFTPRVVPHHPDASVPLEAPFILWHDAPSWR